MSVYETYASGSPQVTRGELARWRHEQVDEELLWPTRPSLLTGDDNPVAEHLLARVVVESARSVQVSHHAGQVVLATSPELQLGV